MSSSSGFGLGRRIALLISYEGTAYCGWQIQTKIEKPSVQGSISQALEKITGEKINLIGSGRTDSGVHATGQVAHFELQKNPIESRKLRLGLNSLLPKSIRILKIREVAGNFHAQRSAEKKQYSYYFQLGSTSLPYLAPFTRWIRDGLNVELMNQASKSLIGVHDFLPFQASGAAPVPTIKEIFECDCTIQPIHWPSVDPSFKLVRFRVIGSGFLKQMVRSLAGTLQDIGEQKREVNSFEEILVKQDRKLISATAPARGLWLETLWYPNPYHQLFDEI